METATAILRKEHEAILRMLDVSEEVARRLERDERVPPQTLTDLLEFFHLFADRCHHGKEEDLLFPLLERKGLPSLGGPTEVMRAEHEEGRILIKQMENAAKDYGEGVAGAAYRWAEAARLYDALLHAHIDKENNVLFNMAEYVLTDAEQQELVRAFRKLENEKIGAGIHERLHASMEKLAGEFERAPSPVSAR